MIIVDSSVWIDYFNGTLTPQTDQLDILLSQQLIGTGDLILAEVLQGFREDKDYQIALQLFQSLQFYNMLNKRLALQTVQNYRLLRKQGITVRKTIDVMIGTFCIENDFSLLHLDKDFDKMLVLGLKIEK
jgi:predicted nucleic acid-binding protein